MSRSTRSSRIRTCLLSGSCTPTEISMITCLDLRSVRVGVCLLKQQKHVRVAGYLPGRQTGFRQRIYEITNHGRAAERRA
jgi:hypothetical protein